MKRPEQGKEQLPAAVGFEVWQHHLYAHQPPVANCPFCYPPSGPPRPPFTERSPFEVIGEADLRKAS